MAQQNIVITGEGIVSAIGVGKDAGTVAQGQTHRYRSHALARGTSYGAARG